MKEGDWEKIYTLTNTHGGDAAAIRVARCDFFAAVPHPARATLFYIPPQRQGRAAAEEEAVGVCIYKKCCQATGRSQRRSLIFRLAKFNY